MPLTKLVTQLLGVPVPSEVIEMTAKLSFRNTILVYLKVEAIDLFADNWLYIHSPELKLGRITNLRNWVPELYGDSDFTVLTLEYWCNNEDAIWAYTDEQYIQLAKQEILKTSLLNGASIADAQVYKIPNCYPFNKIGYKKVLEPIVEYLKIIKNLHPIGRYGTFKYNNQDHSIPMYILVSEIILKNASHDL